MSKDKKESLKKLKFWDKWFIAFGVLIILLMILSFVYFYFESDLLIIFWVILIIPLVISLGFITWGMLYHKYKNKKYLWLFIDFILFWVGLIPISSIIFYFCWMRPKFKKGEGIYN